MFDELETVILTHDIDPYSLKKGDVGTIVHVYEKDAYEVEFINPSGKTIAVLTLIPADISSIEINERPSICEDFGNFKFVVSGTVSSADLSLQTNKQPVETNAKSNRSKEDFFCYPAL